MQPSVCFSILFSNYKACIPIILAFPGWLYNVCVVHVWSLSPSGRLKKTRRKFTWEKFCILHRSSSVLDGTILDIHSSYPFSMHLQYLYLEGNELTCLPDNFFDCLPNLKWLDLRKNCLITLPSMYISRHKNLKNLLLEGNELRTLPLELGWLWNGSYRTVPYAQTCCWAWCFMATCHTVVSMFQYC